MDLIGMAEGLWAFVSRNWLAVGGGFLAVYLLGSLVCLRGVFLKAGQSDWKALVPGLRAYTWWRIAWDGRRYLDTLNFILALAVFSVFITFLQTIGRVVLTAVGVALGIYLAYLRMLLCLHAARRFGRSTAFAVWLLFFLKPVGLAMLSLGAGDYDPTRDRPAARKAVAREAR